MQTSVTQWTLPTRYFPVPLSVVCVRWDVSWCMNPICLNNLWSSKVRRIVTVGASAHHVYRWLGFVFPNYLESISFIQFTLNDTIPDLFLYWSSSDLPYTYRIKLYVCLCVCISAVSVCRCICFNAVSLCICINAVSVCFCICVNAVSVSVSTLSLSVSVSVSTLSLSFYV